MSVESSLINSYRRELEEKAREACCNSYSPYSNFKVGATVLTSNGHVYTGTNIENTSYGLTICAERSAIFSAVSDGEIELIALWLHVQSDKPAYPCGACLQVLSEFVVKDLNIMGTCQTLEKYEGLLSELYNDKFTRERFQLP